MALCEFIQHGSEKGFPLEGLLLKVPDMTFPWLSPRVYTGNFRDGVGLGGRTAALIAIPTLGASVVPYSVIATS